MLEDDYTDVIRKAAVGCGLSEADLLAQLELSEKDWATFLAGDFDVDLAKRVGNCLGLRAEVFSKHPIYCPRPLQVAGIRRLELPFGQWTVNAWWVELGDCRLLFDAGMGPCDVIEALPATPETAFITHAHHDHVGGMEALRDMGVRILSTEALEPGLAIHCGPLNLRTHDLSGHCVPALGYQIEGLSQPVLVVGDALFAGSMGKTANPERYQQALKTLTVALDVLPDEAVLLPGHGPATTVGEERANNPFL